jgi:hypothetical protein
MVKGLGLAGNNIVEGRFSYQMIDNCKVPLRYCLDMDEFKQYNTEGVNIGSNLFLIVV